MSRQQARSSASLRCWSRRRTRPTPLRSRKLHAWKYLVMTSPICSSGNRWQEWTCLPHWVINSMPPRIGIGAAVTRRPLPHHRAYGSVHGGSSLVTPTLPRTMTEARAIRSTHWKAPQREPWPARDTRGHGHFQPYYWPVVGEPPVPAVRPGSSSRKLSATHFDILCSFDRNTTVTNLP